MQQWRRRRRRKNELNVILAVEMGFEHCGGRKDEVTLGSNLHKVCIKSWAASCIQRKKWQQPHQRQRSSIWTSSSLEHLPRSWLLRDAGAADFVVSTRSTATRSCVGVYVRTPSARVLLGKVVKLCVRERNPERIAIKQPRWVVGGDAF